jgi:hypothetical protein
MGKGTITEKELYFLILGDIIYYYIYYIKKIDFKLFKLLFKL